MKNKIAFNYKMYRLASIVAWLFIIVSFIIAIISPITLEEASLAGYIAGSAATLAMLGLGGIGFLWEIKSWFKKVEK